MMKKVITRMLAFAAVLLCGGAWAALDSVWNGDFITLDESGNQVQHLTKTIGSITYTLALNGNKLVYDEATGKSYIEITNTENGQLGATVTRSTGTGNSNGGSVLFKYSNLKKTGHEPNSIICTLWEDSRTEAGYQNITGLQLKSADATNATLSGFWAEGSVNNNGNSENNTSGTIPLASGTVAISYGGTGANVFLKNEATGYWTKVYKSGAYGQNTYSIKGVAFGGFYGAITRTDKTDFTNAAVPQEGLRIHAVAVYDQAPTSGSGFDFEFVEPKTWPADEILVDHCIDMDAWMTTNVTVPDGSESTILTTLRDNYNISGALGGNWVNSETPLAAAARFPTIQDDGILTVELQATDGSNTKAVLVGVKVDGGVLKVKALKAALRGVANSSEKQFNYTSESNITAVYSAGTLKDTYGGAGYAAVRIYFEKKAAAKIDREYYATLEAAFAAATEGQTVTLLANVAGDLTVPANKNVNAAAYTIGGAITIGSGAKLTVAGDRTTNGISGEGTFVVSGGTITANNKANGYAVDGTTIKIDGGTFKLYNAVSGGYTSDKKDPTINNAKFIIAQTGTLTNFGWVNMLGTIEFDYSGNDEKTILGGNAPSFRGTPNIIKSGTGAIYFDMGVATNAKFTSLTLNGGTLRTKADVTVDELISGVTDKAVHYDTATKTYSLVDAVAKIGTVCYATLKAALDAATNGETIKLIDTSAIVPDAYAATYVKTIVGDTTIFRTKNALIDWKSTNGGDWNAFNNANHVYTTQDGYDTTHETGDTVCFVGDVQIFTTANTYGAKIQVGKNSTKTGTLRLTCAGSNSGYLLNGSTVNVCDGSVLKAQRHSGTNDTGWNSYENNVGSKIKDATISGDGKFEVGRDATTILEGTTTISTDIEFTTTGTVTADQKLNIAGTVTLSGSFDSAKGHIFFTANNATLKVPTGTDVGTIESTIGGDVEKTDTVDNMDVYSIVIAAVASIGDREFTSLSDALTTAAGEASDDTSVMVKLLTNYGDAFDIPENVIVDTASHTVSGAITGSGTIKFSSNPTGANLTANAFTASGWTGTVELPALNAPGQVKLQAMGNTGSKIILNGITGSAWLETATVTVNAELILKGNVSFNNGSSNCTYTFKKISCEGDHTLQLVCWSGCTAVTYAIETLNKFNGTIDLNHISSELNRNAPLNFSIGNIVTSAELAAGLKLVKLTKTGTAARIPNINITLDDTTVNGTAETLEWKNDAICLCARDIYAKNGKCTAFELSNNTATTLREGDRVIINGTHCGTEVWQGCVHNLGTHPITIQLAMNLKHNGTDVNGIAIAERQVITLDGTTSDNGSVFIWGDIGANATINKSDEENHYGIISVGHNNHETIIGTGVTIGAKFVVGSGMAAVLDGSVTLTGEIANAGTIKFNENGQLKVPAGRTVGALQSTVEEKIAKKIETVDGQDVYGLVVTPAASVGDQDFADLAEAITYAQTAHLPVVLGKNVEGALNIPGGVTIDSNGLAISGAITGSGTIIFTGTLPTNTFTSEEWRGTVWLKNIGPGNSAPLAASGIASLGNANSTVRMTNVKGYLGSDRNQIFSNAFTLEFKADDTNTFGWDNRSGWGVNKQTYKALAGDGDYIAASSGSTCAERILFTGDSSSFTGGIDVMGTNKAGKRVCFGAEGEFLDDAGSIVIGSGKTMQIAATKTWKAAKVKVIGTVKGSGTIDAALEIVDGATIDVTGNKALRLADNKNVTFGESITLVGVAEGQSVLTNVVLEPENLLFVRVTTKTTADAEGVQQGRLEYDSTAKTVIYTAAATTYWTVNPAKVNNGVFVWDATDAWLGDDGETIRSWSDAPTGTKAKIDADIVSSVVIGGQITAGEVVVVNTRGNAFAFDNHTQKVDGHAEMDAATDCLHAKVNVVNFDGELGIRVAIDGAITLGSRSNIVFVTPEVEDTTTAYPYSLAGRNTPIKVRGPGSFLVPEGMYADPFEIENGTLVYSVANGQTKAINGIISGQGSVQKIGAGAANFGGANTFMGGLYVDEGTAKLAVAKGFGGSDRNGLVYVAPGASIDIAAGDSTNYDIHTAGTIFSTTGIGNNSMQTRKLTLEGDTTIGGSANFGFIAYNFAEVPINIGAHTLTVDKTGNLWMVYTTVSGIGTIDVAKGTVQCYGNNNGGQGGFTMADGTLKISGGTFAVGAKNATIKNLDLSSGSITRSTGTITVTGRISGNGTTTALALSDMCVIDLGTNSHPTFGELTLGNTFVLDAIRLENPTDGQTLVTFASEEAATDALSKASFMPPAAGWKISTNGSSIVLEQAQTGDPITQLTENITDGNDVSIRAQGDTSIAINASGVLTIDVPADHLTLSGVISGTCQVHKTGAGTLTLSGANTFTGGLFVHEGTVVSGAGSSLSTGPIVVDTGAALNFNSNRSSVGYDVILNGGLLMGGGGNAHDRYIRSLTLLKNSYIGRTTDQGTAKCDILGLGTGSGGASSLDLNGNTLTIYAGGNFYFESVTAKSAGTIRLYEGNLLTHHNAPDLSGTKLIIESGAKIEVDSSEGNSHTLIVSDLIYNGSSATEGGGTIKVTGSYTGTGNVSKLTLAAGAKIVPLEEGELNFNGAVTLGGDVHIDLTNVEAAKKIANWAAVPTGGSFVPEGRSNATVVSGADGLYTIPVSVKLPNVQVNGETVTDRFTRMEYYLLTGKTEEGYTFVPPAFVTPDQSSSSDSMSIKVALPTPLNGISGYLSLKAKSGNGVWKRIAVQKPESSGTCTFDVPFSEILKGSTKCALFSLEAETAQKPVGYDAKMLAKTPIADGACGWTTAGKVDRTTMGTGTDSGALYRIVAVAKGNGMITTMYDARSNFKDLGQAAVWNDWAGNDSFDNGDTWSPARLMIDVPNWGDSSQGAHARKECDLIDPCLGYDANRQKFVVMGLTGGGLAGSSKVAYAGDNDLVIYERDAVKDSQWVNRTSVEKAILDALEVAMGDDGTDWTVCRGVLQGPGHAYTTPTDLVRGDITIPAGTPIFAMQYFQDFASPNYSFVAWYTIENGNMKWHTTKLTMVSGGHEPSVTVLDDGSLYMIAKAGSRWAFRSTDYVNWVRCADAGTSQSVQGSILKIGSKDGTGVYAHATCTSGRAQIKVFIGTDNSLISNTANSAPVTWNNSEAAANVWPNDCWTQGYTTMFMVDEHTLGVIFEAQSHVYFQAVDISAYVD